MQSMMPYLQKDLLIASKAKRRTHDMLHYKAACLPTDNCWHNSIKAGFYSASLFLIGHEMWKYKILF